MEGIVNELANFNFNTSPWGKEVNGINRPGADKQNKRSLNQASAADRLQQPSNLTNAQHQARSTSFASPSLSKSTKRVTVIDTVEEGSMSSSRRGAGGFDRRAPQVASS